MKTIRAKTGELIQCPGTFEEIRNTPIGGDIVIRRDIMATGKFALMVLIPNKETNDLEERWFEIVECDRETAWMRRVEKPTSQ